MRLIDADALKNDIDTSYTVFGQCVYAKGIVDRQPTIEPGKHGRWNRNEAALDYVEPDGAEHHHGICSECGLIYDFGERKHWYNFCPNCGADMAEPVNGGAQE